MATKVTITVANEKFHTVSGTVQKLIRQTPDLNFRTIGKQRGVYLLFSNRTGQPASADDQLRSQLEKIEGVSLEEEV